MQAAGFVTRFAVKRKFVQKYLVHAEKLPQFNGKLRNRRKNCRG